MVSKKAQQRILEIYTSNNWLMNYRFSWTTDTVVLAGIRKINAKYPSWS
jgi:hypothetical protein